MIRFILFISIFLSIYLASHYFVYYQIVQGLNIKRPASFYLRLFFWFGALSFVAGEFLSRKYVSLWIQPIAHYGAVWIGLISIALTIFLIRQIFVTFINTDGFRHYSVFGSLAITLILSGYSFYAVLMPEKLREITIKTDKLNNLKSFSIVHLSDMHLNTLKSPKRLKEIVERVNSLNPDIVVITGDLIDADLCNPEEFRSVLQGLKPGYGTYAVTGNHEFYAGLDKYYSLLNNTKIKPLRNENITIAGSVELLGVDDAESRRFTNTAVNRSLLRAFHTPKPADKDKFIILLSHRPELFETAQKLGVDLQLSGHTHMGQIPPMDLLVWLYYRHPYGLYKTGNSFLYTTSGTGYWGPPMRLSSRSEIVRIVLHK